MQIVEALKNAFRGPAEMPAGEPYPNTAFSAVELRRDRLHGRVTEARRWRIDCAADEAELRDVEARLAAMHAHNDAIETRHAAECNLSKSKARRAQGGRELDAEEW
jgi:hypothetical protein